MHIVAGARSGEDRANCPPAEINGVHKQSKGREVAEFGHMRAMGEPWYGRLSSGGLGAERQLPDKANCDSPRELEGREKLFRDVDEVGEIACPEVALLCPPGEGRFWATSRDMEGMW